MRLVVDEKILNLVKVKLLEKPRIIKETLSRMGIGNPKSKVLWQLCHLINIRDEWFIIHYKETYMLQGKEVFWREEDIIKRNEISRILQDWNLVEIINPLEIDLSYGFDVSGVDDEEKKFVYRIKHSMREQYEILTKVNILAFMDSLQDWNQEQKEI